MVGIYLSVIWTLWISLSSTVLHVPVNMWCIVICSPAHFRSSLFMFHTMHLVVIRVIHRWLEFIWVMWELYISLSCTAVHVPLNMWCIVTCSLPIISIHVSYDVSIGYIHDASMVGIYLSAIRALCISLGSAAVHVPLNMWCIVTCSLDHASIKSIHVSYDVSIGYTCDSSMIGIYLSVMWTLCISLGSVQQCRTAPTTEYVMYRHLLTCSCIDQVYSCAIRCIYWLYAWFIYGWNLLSVMWELHISLSSVQQCRTAPTTEYVMYRHLLTCSCIDQVYSCAIRCIYWLYAWFIYGWNLLSVMWELHISLSSVQQCRTAPTTEYVMYRHLLTCSCIDQVYSCAIRCIYWLYAWFIDGWNLLSVMWELYISLSSVQQYSTARTTEYVMYRHLLTSDHLYSWAIWCS